MDSPRIMVITATYDRPRRLAYLKRCARVLSRVDNILWIVVEDGGDLDEKVRGLLSASSVEHVYLRSGPTHDKGHTQKESALGHISRHRLTGLVYIADDDNYYDARLFGEIRKTKRVSAFPVGNLGPKGVERPLVSGGKVTGWEADWPGRKFPLDWAGFAFDASCLSEFKGPLMPSKSFGGETEFLEEFVASPEGLEPLCDECRRCYVWHNEPLRLHARLGLRLFNLARRVLK